MMRNTCPVWSSISTSPPRSVFGDLGNELMDLLASLFLTSEPIQIEQWNYWRLETSRVRPVELLIESVHRVWVLARLLVFDHLCDALVENPLFGDGTQFELIGDT